MSNRVRVGIIFGIICLAFLLPGASTLLRWFPLVGFTILIFMASFELHKALLRRLPNLSFIPVILSVISGISPIMVWIWYNDLTFWHNLPIGEGLPEEFLLNDAWLTNYVWLMGLGLAVYAGVFCVSQMTYAAIRIVRKGPEQIPYLGIQIASQIFLSFPLAIVTLFLYAVPNGYKWLLLAILIAVVTDVSAYYVGKNFGKHKILPKISPNKTVQGFFGGLLFSILIAALYFVFIMRGSMPQMEKTSSNLLFGIGMGLVGSLAAQFGDWIASALKRWSKLKDFSHILGDHGGILDRCDSILATLPWVFIGSLLYYFLER